MNERPTITDALTTLGLSPNAITLYITSYTMGKSSIGVLATTCNMDRSSAYLAFQQLCDVGLMNDAHQRGRKIVWAKPPRAILSRLRAHIRSLRQQYDHVEQSLPELMASYREQNSKPVLQYYSGKSGLKQITDDVFECAEDEILLFTNQREEKKVFTSYDHTQFIQDRRARQLRIRVLAVDTPEAHELIKHDGQCLRETRIIDSDTTPFRSETYIYADKVAMLEFNRDIMGFIVQSSEFATAQRWIFEQLWKRYR